MAEKKQTTKKATPAKTTAAKTEAVVKVNGELVIKQSQDDLFNELSK